MSVGAVVVNHNAGDALVACVESLAASGVAQVVVVDNDSSDASVAALRAASPTTGVIETGRNLGYGSAVNVGRRALSSDYLLVCNPDLLVAPGTAAQLASYLDRHPEVAVVGPRILEPGGAVYPSARAFPNVVDAFGHGLLSLFWPANPFTRRYKLGSVDGREATIVDWVSGACLLARAAAFDEVGGFDESYFMYVEDLDLCWRLRGRGWEVAYEPGTSVVHQGGLSSHRHPYRMLVAHHRSTWRFARRSLTGRQSLLLPFVGLGITARLALALARQALVRPRVRANPGSR